MTSVPPEIAALYRQAVAERDAAEAVVQFFDRVMHATYALQPGDKVQTNGVVTRANEAPQA